MHCSDHPPSVGVPSFSHHLMSFGEGAAPRTSISPSLSRSVAYKPGASLKLLSIVRLVQPPFAGVPSFSHQAISCVGPQANPSTSISLSPSKSVPIICTAPLKLPAIVCSVQPPSEGVPSFSHQVISCAVSAAPSTSMSPSPSTSAAWTARAPLKLPSIVRFVKLSSPSFSHQVMSSAIWAAPRMSISPSPSRSLAKISAAPL